MITKPCPECGVEISIQARRHTCGWTAHVNDRKTVDNDRWRCVHEDRGQRCAAAGVVSPSTHGGAFYCWAHVPALQQMQAGVRTPPPVGFFANWRKKLGPKPFDFEAEAERIAIQGEPTNVVPLTRPKP